MRLIFTYILLFTIASCSLTSCGGLRTQNSQHQTELSLASAKAGVETEIWEIIAVIGGDTIYRNEHFADSLHIGRAGLNKIELNRYVGPDSVYVVIRFYTKSKQNRWVQQQEFSYDKDLISDCDPQISDFNNDGSGDFTYVSATAARGANEIRRLFIYDKKADKLVYIRNSEDYPNLGYNKELNCIEAFAVYGGCSTLFAKIEADSLHKFAAVELFDGRLTVTKYDRSGNARILKDEPTDEAFVQYVNYNLLKIE